MRRLRAAAVVPPPRWACAGPRTLARRVFAAHRFIDQGSAPLAMVATGLVGLLGYLSPQVREVGSRLPDHADMAVSDSVP